MDELKMILSDESEVVMKEFAIPMHAMVVCQTEDEAISIWKRLTPGNLANVRIKHGDDIILGYHNAMLTGVQVVNNLDGTFIAHYYMEGERVVGNEEDSAYIAAAKIMLGEEV